MEKLFDQLRGDHGYYLSTEECSRISEKLPLSKNACSDEALLAEELKPVYNKDQKKCRTINKIKD